MSEPPRIPPVEQPRESAESSIREEEDTLDKQAKSATYRDAHERKQHLESLYRRIDVLQSKLDKSEDQIQKYLPRLAQLEHACCVSQVLVRDGTIILAVGGAFIGYGSLFANDPLIRFAMGGVGVGLTMTGLWIAKILNRNSWPPLDQR
jgi:hypothetical protein